MSLGQSSFQLEHLRGETSLVAMGASGASEATGLKVGNLANTGVCCQKVAENMAVHWVEQDGRKAGLRAIILSTSMCAGRV